MSDIFNGRLPSGGTGATTTTTTESLLVRSILRFSGGIPNNFVVHLMQPYTNVISISLVHTTFDFSSVSTVTSNDNTIRWNGLDTHLPPGNYPTLTDLLAAVVSSTGLTLGYDPLTRCVTYKSTIGGTLLFPSGNFSSLLGFHVGVSYTTDPTLRYAPDAPLGNMRSVGMELSNVGGNFLGFFNLPNPTPINSTTAVVSPTFDRQTFSVSKMMLNDFSVILTDTVLDEWEMMLEVTCEA